jgi:hypothetical protein
MAKEKFDFEAFVRQAGQQLRSGKPFTGSEGVFTPLIKQILEASLEGELDEHLEQTRTETKNRRNGHTQKNIQSSWEALIFFRPATEMPASSRRRFPSVNGSLVKTSINRSWLSMDGGFLTVIFNRILKKCMEWNFLTGR